ncbi:type III toxin-antitoxin system ToxN/AbiQ family toxin [bacterium]|nr:type III toxin-antitoxin system ToxN/AbiQ family toxin [bacterium]
MIPVPENLTEKIVIDPLKDTYLMNEYRYIRKHWLEITQKSLSIYIERYDKNSRNYDFFSSICCDFKMLEEKYNDWISSK